MKRTFQALLLILMLLFPLCAQALRCGSRLAVEGDSEFRVLNICGAPAFQETYYRTEQTFNPYGYYSTESTVKYDKWTYNFGSTQFLYLLTFREGVLDKVETNGYGF